MKSSAVTKVSSASVVANELKEWMVMIVSKASDRQLYDGWSQFVERDPSFPNALVQIFVRYLIGVSPGRRFELMASSCLRWRVTWGKVKTSVVPRVESYSEIQAGDEPFAERDPCVPNEIGQNDLIFVRNRIAFVLGWYFEFTASSCLRWWATWRKFKSFVVTGVGSDSEMQS